MKRLWEKFKRYKHLAAGVLLAASAAAGGLVYDHYHKEQAAAVASDTVIAAGRGNVRATVAATGTLKAVNTVEISSRVTGLLKEVKVKENDLVKAGQVLAVLDDSSLRAQVSQYEAQLANYAGIYERSKRLYEMGAIAVQQLDADRTSYLTARAQYDNYASQLDYYVIKSPIGGMVVGEPTPAGQTVAQGISSPQVIMTIADLSKMKIKVLVDETDIGKVKVGQPVSFTVDAYQDKTFTGRVTDISRSATTSSNVVYYPVYVAVDAPEGLLFPSMTARVTVIVGESKDAVVVPLAALKDDHGQKHVQVVVGNKTESRPVKVGLQDDEWAEVLEGLAEGEQVVVPMAKTQATTANKQQLGPPPPI